MKLLSKRVLLESGWSLTKTGNYTKGETGIEVSRSGNKIGNRAYIVMSPSFGAFSVGSLEQLELVVNAVPASQEIDCEMLQNKYGFQKENNSFVLRNRKVNIICSYLPEYRYINVFDFRNNIIASTYTKKSFAELVLRLYWS